MSGNRLPQTERRPWADEYTLLCERCGYVTEGLPTEGNCPECGKPIAESLPERRTGTPWQREASWDTVRETWGMTLRHPARTLDTLHPQTSLLREFTHGTATAIVCIGWVIAFAVMYRNPTPKDESGSSLLLLLLGTTFLVAVTVTILLALLTWIEQRGIVFFGARRSLRLSAAYASAICDHGSVGWIISALGSSIAAILIAIPESVPNKRISSFWYLAPFIAAIPGFLFFEWFAWLGLRRCKFANRVRPASEPQPEEV